MESRQIEQKEEVKVTFKTVTAQELFGLIYGKESVPKDRRFLPHNQGGSFKYFDLRELIASAGRESNFYSFVEEDGQMVGLAGLEVDPYKEKNLWVKFVSVDPKFQGRGLASKLIREIFRFAHSQGYSLETSAYSDEGEQKIKKVFDRVAKEFPVEVIEQRKR